MRRIGSRKRSEQETIPRRSLGSAPGLSEVTQTTRLKLPIAGWTMLWALLALVMAVTPIAAQVTTTCPPGAICNGARNGLFTELFFEPETPPGSLKTAPPSALSGASAGCVDTIRKYQRRRVSQRAWLSIISALTVLSGTGDAPPKEITL